MLSSFDILTVTPRTVPNPLISILVPLYNEEEWIGALLERVLAAPLPEGVTREIVVVDDGSTDGSEKVVEENRGEISRHDPLAAAESQSREGRGDS
jgi:CDP-glycerol glycerophosphotransferase